jgi:hypothetical protein
MKIIVDLPEKELRDVIRFSGEKKKGPAIRKFIVAELMLRRRREMSQKVLAGKLSAELPPIEKLKKDRDL